MSPTDGYHGILRSTALLGSARILSMLVALARSKLIAVLLGPGGIGLLGTYEALTAMVMTIAGMGLNTSGVRQVAVESATPSTIARIATSINRLAFLFVGAATVVMAVTTGPLSRYTFQSDSHKTELLILAPSVCLMVVSCGRVAVIQGLGQISGLAQMSLMISVIGAAGSIALIACLRTSGIAISILFASLVSYVISVIYANRANLPLVSVPLRATAFDAKLLIRLGLAAMNAAFLSASVAYIARAMISRDIGIQAVGLYVCAYGLSGKFIGVLLDSMRTDFYPRISAVSEVNPQVNSVVNQQIEVALLLAVPGLFGTIIFAPWLIRVFYSSNFVTAALLLRVFALGCFVSVVAGPLRMIQLAKGKSIIYACTETLTNACHVLLIFLLLRLVGLPGAALAYVLHYTLQAVLSYVVAHKLTGFRFTRQAGRMVAGFTAAAVCALAIPILISGWQYLVAGGVGILISSLYCARRLISLLGSDHWLPRFIASQPVIGRLILPV